MFLTYTKDFLVATKYLVANLTMCKACFFVILFTTNVRIITNQQEVNEANNSKIPCNNNNCWFSKRENGGVSSFGVKFLLYSNPADFLCIWWFTNDTFFHALSKYWIKPLSLLQTLTFLLNILGLLSYGSGAHWR